MSSYQMIFGHVCRKAADETKMPTIIKIVLSDLNDGGDDRTYEFQAKGLPKAGVTVNRISDSEIAIAPKIVDKSE